MALPMRAPGTGDTTFLQESFPSFSSIGGAFKKLGKKAGEGLKKAAEKTGEGLKKAAEKTGEGLKKAAEKTGEGLKDAANGVKDWGEDVGEGIAEGANEAWDKTGKGVAAVGKVAGVAVMPFKNAYEKTKEAFKVAAKWGKGALESAASWSKDAVGDAVDWSKGAFNAVKNFFNDLFGEDACGHSKFGQTCEFSSLRSGVLSVIFQTRIPRRVDSPNSLGLCRSPRSLLSKPTAAHSYVHCDIWRLQALSSGSSACSLEGLHQEPRNA